MRHKPITIHRHAWPMRSYGGLRFAGGRWRRDYLVVEGDRFAGWSSEPKEDLVEGVILPPLIDAHVHTADTFLRDRLPPDIDLDGAVGPGGLKHRALADADGGTVIDSIASFLEEAASRGVAAAIDFREGGVRGLELLREAVRRHGSTIGSGDEGGGTADMGDIHGGSGPVGGSVSLAGGTMTTPLRTHVVPLGRPDGDDIRGVLAASAGLGLSALRDLRWEDAKRWAAAAHDAGKALALHASEERREDIDRVLSLRPDMLVHCTACTEGDLRAIARRGVPVVVCPRSNDRFGIDLDVGRMLRAGVTVALGTDNGMVADPAPLREIAFLIGELDMSLLTALGLLANAKVFIPPFDIPLDPRTGDCVVVEGRRPEDVPDGRVVAAVVGGRLRTAGGT